MSIRGMRKTERTWLVAAVLASFCLHALLFNVARSVDVSKAGPGVGSPIGGRLEAPALRVLMSLPRPALAMRLVEVAPPTPATQRESSFKAAAAEAHAAAEASPSPFSSPLSGSMPPGSSAVAGLLAPAYLDREQLDEPPQPLSSWQLDGAHLSRDRPWSMVLNVWVSQTGVVDGYELVRASPPGPWADHALAVFKQSALRPGVRHGQPVASVFTIEISSEDDWLY